MLLTPAFASDYDETAQQLKDLGLFKGTDLGFDLDRAPTRTEAAVMLVRLLGAEEEAKTQYAAGTVSHPFTDVPEWADASVAWLYTNNLAKGVSDTAFGATGQCTAKMFCTFVLRSLGYSDGSNGDFTFDSAEDFAENLGIYNTEMTDGTFLRDNAVFISYEALAETLKNTQTSLLEKLVAKGAVSDISAANLLKKIKVYNIYEAAYYKWLDQTALDMTINESLKLTSTTLNVNASFEAKYKSKVIMTDSDVQIESIRTVIDGDNILTSSMWLKDGFIYVKSGSQKYKSYAGADQVNDLLYSEYASTKPIMYYLFSVGEINTYQSAGDTIVNMNIPNYQINLEDIQPDFEDSDIQTVVVNSYTTTVELDSSGMIKTYTTKINYTMTALAEGQTTKIDCEYVHTATVNTYGGTVWIQYPDFSDYALQ